MAASFTVPSSPAVYTKSYKNFLGVDFRAEDYTADGTRFPYAQNLIIDKTGFPEKRPGFRIAVNSDEKIWGVFTGYAGDEVYTVIHSGRSLKKLVRNQSGYTLSVISKKNGSEGNVFYTEEYMPEKKCLMYCADGYIYILGADENATYTLRYDGDYVEDLKNTAEPPVLFEDRNLWYMKYRDNSNTSWETERSDEPGVSVDKINLLCEYAVCRFKLSNFISNMTTRQYRSYQYLYPGTNVKSIEYIKVYTTADKWVTLDPSLYSCMDDYVKIYVSNGAQSADDYVAAPELKLNVFNAEIKFKLESGEDNIKKICSYTAATQYGIGRDDRVFLCGSSEEKNYVRYSEFEKGGCFPDLNYIVAGTDESRCIGFSKMNNSLIVHKNSENMVNVFLVTGQMSGDDAVFSVTYGIAGRGAVSDRSFANVDGEALFLTDDGVFALETSYISSEKSITNRSGFINPMFEKENDKQKAQLIKWKNLLMIFINGRVYTMNTNQKSYTSSYTQSYNRSYYYESMLWTGIDADEAFTVKDELFFYKNTDDGKGYIAKFNTDIENDRKYTDISLTGDSSRAIDSYFMTKYDDDSSFMILKTMTKRGSGILIKPHTRTSAEIYAVTDRRGKFLVKEARAGIFDFSDFSFQLVSFNSRAVPGIIPFNTKIKKYCALQFIVRNNEKGQGFGVYGIEKRFTMGNYKKY